jgi:hypothetical protein
MPPTDRRDTGVHDFFRARLDQIIDWTTSKLRAVHGLDVGQPDGEAGFDLPGQQVVLASPTSIS